MRIGVVGSGGAGTTAAWLLDREHDVTLFERNEVLGGHAHTTKVALDGRDYFCDDGAAWFSDRMYPLLLRLFQLNGVETEVVPLGVTFTNRAEGVSVAMPPNRPGDILRILKQPARLRALLALNEALRQARGIVERREREQSLGAFVQGLKMNRAVLEGFVQPFLFGIWGGPWERSADFAAYPVLKYPIMHRPIQLRRVRWQQVKGGAASYIARVAQSFETTRVLRSTAVAGLARRGDEWVLHDEHGEGHTFDRIVLATGAKAAKALLASAPGLSAQKEALSGFEYYRVRLATHGDASFMPPDRADWKTVHVDFDGRSARFTSWVGWREGVDLFTSYVADREPETVYSWNSYDLPLVSPAHFVAQRELADVQGQDGLWFAGDWTQDIGSHEDAVRSGADIARALAPQSERLRLLAGDIYPVLATA
ncbi:MAG: FAD-dependent oxidoreductase [Deltaproteobacteria bacterium]|nr:FAD-dependent oxidoreductase [Deltaproteobacteria bacterium]